ncbi:MAG TPA: hypothetical protein PLM66_11840 [Candidatus Latescibacteria bacterium]|nr:hypothetical protein [Candidatus Latescibacterota bacterium]
MFSEWDVFFDTGDPPIAVILWGVNTEQAANADWEQTSPARRP